MINFSCASFLMQLQMNHKQISASLLASSLFSPSLSFFLLTFSLLLEQWQAWVSRSAPHFRTVSLGLTTVILGARTLWGSCKKIVGYLLKSEAVILLSYLPFLLLWLFPPSFHFPPTSSQLASLMHQALCRGLWIKTGKKKRSRILINLSVD